MPSTIYTSVAIVIIFNLLTRPCPAIPPSCDHTTTALLNRVYSDLEHMPQQVSFEFESNLNKAECLIKI